MSYSDSLDEFHGLPVQDYNALNSDWSGPNIAYRLREEYDDEVTINDRLEALLDEDGSDQLVALIIGAWTGSCEGDDSATIVAKLVEIAPRLPALRHLFLGEMTFEECEISWINQSDVSPLLTAYPQLQSLHVRGGSGLSFSRVSHPELRTLVIETGGLPRSVLREIFLCDFPNLEHLELLLGTDNYGFDGSVEDLQPVLSGRLYPKLKYLGLRNSEIANDIAAVIVHSPIVERINELDLSLGTLDDEGIQSLMSLANRRNLRRLNIAHHYGTVQAVQELVAALPFEVDASDPQEADDEWRPVLHAE